MKKETINKLMYLLIIFVIYFNKWWYNISGDDINAFKEKKEE